MPKTTYVALDYDEDSKNYNLLKAWKEKDEIDFEFYDAHDLNNLRDGSQEETIKNKLKERLKRSTLFILLLGEKTKNKHKYVRWEVEQAIKLGIPIIVVNLNCKRKCDNDRIPAILEDQLYISVSFESKIILYAFERWPKSHKKHKEDGETGCYSYKDSVYKELGL